MKRPVQEASAAINRLDSSLTIQAVQGVLKCIRNTNFRLLWQNYASFSSMRTDGACGAD